MEEDGRSTLLIFDILGLPVRSDSLGCGSVEGATVQTVEADRLRLDWNLASAAHVILDLPPNPSWEYCRHRSCGSLSPVRIMGILSVETRPTVWPTGSPEIEASGCSCYNCRAPAASSLGLRAC